MLPLHAVPSWCTLHVSTSAVLDVFSLGDLASASGSGSAQEIGDQEPGPFCATRRRRCSPAGWVLGQHFRQDEEESSEYISCSSHGFLAAGRSLVSVLGRGFNPI